MTRVSLSRLELMQPNHRIRDILIERGAKLASNFDILMRLKLRVPYTIYPQNLDTGEIVIEQPDV